MEAQYLLNKWSQENFGVVFEDLKKDEKATLESRLQTFLRVNTYDETSKKLVIERERYEAFLHIHDFYSKLFMNDPELKKLRADRSEEHTSELQSRPHLVCRLLLEKNKHI